MPQQGHYGICRAPSNTGLLGWLHDIIKPFQMPASFLQVLTSLAQIGLEASSPAYTTHLRTTPHAHGIAWTQRLSRWREEEEGALSVLGYPPPSQGKPPATSPSTHSCPAVNQHTKLPHFCFGWGESSLASCYAKLLPSTSIKSMQFPTAENQISSLNHLHYTSQRTAQNRAAMQKPTAES